MVSQKPGTFVLRRLVSKCTWLVGWLTAWTLFGQEFKITDASMGSQGRFTVTFAPSTDFYYVLRRGNDPSSIILPRAMALGGGNVGRLEDPSNAAAAVSSFYQVQRVPITEPLDADGDRITDVFELQRGSFLNPLDPSDATKDYDGDGISNLQEFLDRSNPADLPGDPSAAAPPVSSPDLAGLAQSTSFLYSGANPIQTGAVPSVFDAKRVSVLRGKVTGADGAGLPGVGIKVLNHPEFGQTKTRADGMFDMAVNGGGSLTVVYSRPGYCPIQRTLSTPWNDYLCMPDVTLITMDPQVTQVALGTNAPTQVAQGSVQTDQDGARRATLILPAGTCANLVVNGQTQNCSSLRVRATEFTVGANGAARMPAALPPSSAYTYCVELSADEADGAGAESVQFTQPLCLYLENFLNFPVGQSVPTGYYDRKKGVWVASRNGRVIKILSVSAGLALVDADGDGIADGPGQLAALGITDDERHRIAQLYAPSQTLWRTCVTHFTPWDCNWPGGPPPGATPPPDKSPDDKPLDDPCNVSGSVIGAENQTLGEALDIVGTPFRLHYQSDRVLGNKSAYTIQIPLSEATIPNGLNRITLTVDVAGRAFTQEYPPQPNQRLSFTWDGYDAYGRFVPGTQPVKVRIGYIYNAVYYSPSEFDQAFAEFTGDTITANSGRGEVTIWRRWSATVGTRLIKPLGLGEWTLDVVHGYDSLSKTLYLGDGGRRSVSGVDVSVINTFAGGGRAPGDDIGDGKASTDAELAVPSGLAVGPDGSVYIAEQNGQRIRKVTPNGIISTIAGSALGQACFPSTNACGDGGPATDARLNAPHGVAVATDGTVYIADRASNRIRKVDPNGMITTVAGTGLYGFSGDGGPAALAQVNSPYGVAVGSDGLLYIADTGNGRIRRIGSDGIIITVAGGGAIPGPEIGDGGPATKAELSQPWRIAFDPDGNMFIVDRGQYRIRRVGIDGIISTVAGSFPGGSSGDGGPASLALFGQIEDIAMTPDGGYYLADRSNARVRFVGRDGIITTFAGNGVFGFLGDGGPATQAKLSEPIGLAVGPDGSLYEADWFNQRVRKISTALPGFSANDTAIPSADGTQVYVFDNGGRHLQTLDAFTRAIRYTFTYDSQRRLRSVTDGDGNVTAVERDAAGMATAIVGPYGDRTELGINNAGELERVRNPAGATTLFEYRSGGLLSRFTDARLQALAFSYDELGRLVRDADPAGGFKALARTDTETGHIVELSTALGRTNRYEVVHTTTGDRKRLYTFPTGLRAEYEEQPNGQFITRLPDGSVSTVLLGPDPRWGMLSPVVASSTTVTPGGLTNEVTTARTVVLTNAGDPLSLKSWTETTTMNGRTFTESFDAMTRVLTRTSPKGRKLIAVLDSFMRPVREEIAGLQPTFYDYDSRGRIHRIRRGVDTSARTNTFTYDANGRVAAAVDQLGRSAALNYDAAGRVILQKFPDGRLVQFKYDAVGNTVGVTPPGRPDHRFTFSPVNLESQYSPPAVGGGGSAYDFEHNLERELTQIRRPDGRIVRLDYTGDGCNCGQLVSVTQPRGTNIYAYDPVTRNPTSISAPAGLLLTQAYDGSILTSEAWSGPVSGRVARAYDRDVRVISQTVNGANQVDFKYDDDGLLIQAGSLRLTNDPQHGLITASVLEKVTERWVYNGFGEVVSHSASFGPTLLFSSDYTRDALGRIIAITEVVEGITNRLSYSYDLAGNLTMATKNASLVADYAYDANRNRVSSSGPGGTVNASHDDQDRLVQHGSAVYAYSAGGELQTRTAAGQISTFDYDALGNLVGAVLPDGVRVDYLIDGRNRRIGRKRNGVLVQAFLYDGPRNCVAELDGFGNVVSRFVYGSREDVPDLMIRGGTTYRIISDHVGSVRLVVNAATGGIVQRKEYDPFGQELSDTAPGFQPFGFAGGVYDTDTKLIRFGARDYDSETGRWTARDPILFEGRQANLYAYANNDPVNLRDPDGLQTLPDFDKQQQNKKPGNERPKELKCPPKRDVMKEYQNVRKEFAGEKSEKAAKKQKNALDQAADGINGGLSGNNY
ncbi:MAG: hypothetical protein IT581_08930 [Verrucomicrobiales bacterium]|nr:hypothetical protein [Verrucomicrobiales bacterium]